MFEAITILALLAAIAINVVLIARYQARFDEGYLAGWDAACFHTREALAPEREGIATDEPLALELAHEAAA